MGLDNYFVRTDESPEDIKFPEELKLCGGMCSGHGSDGSLRGKVYTLFFDEALNTSLYQEIEPDIVEVLAGKIEAFTKSYPGLTWTEYGWRVKTREDDREYYDVSPQEIADLAKLFRAAADQKLKLVAWY